LLFNIKKFYPIRSAWLGCQYRAIGFGIGKSRFG
jgi:hypothetical protein